MFKHSVTFYASVAMLSLALPVTGCVAEFTPEGEPVDEAEGALGGDCAAEGQAVIAASSAALACHAANPNAPACCCALDDAFFLAECVRDMCVVREAGGIPSACGPGIMCSLQAGNPTPRCAIRNVSVDET